MIWMIPKRTLNVQQLTLNSELLTPGALPGSKFFRSMLNVGSWKFDVRMFDVRILVPSFRAVPLTLFLRDHP